MSSGRNLGAEHLESLNILGADSATPLCHLDTEAAQLQQNVGDAMELLGKLPEDDAEPPSNLGTKGAEPRTISAPKEPSRQAISSLQAASR